MTSNESSSATTDARLAALRAFAERQRMLLGDLSVAFDAYVKVTQRGQLALCEHAIEQIEREQQAEALGFVWAPWTPKGGPFYPRREQGQALGMDDNGHHPPAEADSPAPATDLSERHGAVYVGPDHAEPCACPRCVTRRATATHLSEADREEARLHGEELRGTAAGFFLRRIAGEGTP